MDNEQNLPESPPPNEAPLDAELESQPPVVPELPAPPKKVTGWAEYAEATLGPDGKKRDAEGNEVHYPHHLAQ